MDTRTADLFKGIAVIALVITMACPYAYAADVGKITYIEGRVDVARVGSDVATPLREGDPIAVGDAVRTKSNSKTEVTFNDKSMLRLAQNTRIEVRDYVLDADNNRKTAEIMVDRGRARTIIEKMPGLTDFNISTPNAKGTVRGSDVYTSFQAGSSNMLVAEGSLSIMNPAIPKEVLTVPAGNSVVVSLDETPKGVRPYMEFEKKQQEEETAIPAGVARNPNATILKGAFTEMSGDVRVTSKGSETPHKATINEILEEGDTIETGNDGIAEISFENGNGMSLKENTIIKIIKLVQDPKTGQYENKFESSMGKVRARIEKLKETNSTFEVRTPTGVCGARGTLMYLEIIPGNTKVFFEGGNGYLHSLISSIQRIVDAGQSAYADNGGNVSEPRTLSAEEREGWGAGWGAGNGTEGYSAPDGSAGIYLDSGDTGPNGGLEIIGSTDANTDDPFIDVPLPIEESNPLVFDSNFNLEGDIFYSSTQAGTIYDSEGGLVGSFWNEEQNADFISEGGFYLTNPAEEPFVWTVTEDVLQSKNPDTGCHITLTGGAFYGIAGGVGAGDADGGILEGLSSFLYVDPQGYAGIGSGKLIGEYSNKDGDYILLSDGSGLAGKRSPSDSNIGVTAQDMYAFAEGGAIWTNSGNGENSMDDDGMLTMSLVNRNTHTAQTWGIYGGRGTDVFQTSPSDGFVWHVGGQNSFGAYYNAEAAEGMEYFYYDNGYWLVDLTSASVADNKLSGSFLGKFLTGTKIGTISGDMLGTYISDLSWQGVSAGEWYGDPLTFSGKWDSESGLIGAAASPWKDLAPFLAIGEFVAETPGSAFVWDAPIESYNVITGSDTTIDGGFFYGRTAGLHDNEKVIGSGVAIYVDPDGIAGVLSSDLNGSYPLGVDTWMVEGIFDAERIANGFNPRDLSVLSGDISASYDGDIATNLGAIHYISGENWGIYNFYLDDVSNIYERASGSKTWSAEITGNGLFGDNYTLGTMEGDVYGIYYGAELSRTSAVVGAWNESENYSGTGSETGGVYYGLLGGIWDGDLMIGKMVGIYAQPGDVALYESTLSLVEGKSTGSFYDPAIGDIRIDYLSGTTIQFTGTDWCAWSMTMRGSYPEAPVRDMSVFKQKIIGYNTPVAGSGNYWIVLCSGLLNKGSERISGATRGMTLYGGKTGLSSGNMLGVMIDPSNWETVGLGVYEMMGSTTRLDPVTADDFISYIETGSFSAINGDGGGTGKFDNGHAINATYMDGVSMNFYGSSWGIWEANMSGNRDVETSSMFKIAIAGSTDIERSEYGDSCMIATITGTLNSDVMAAKFNGVWLESAGPDPVNDYIRAGTMIGVVDGYIDVAENSGTWNAATVGEWVEVTALLTTDKLGFDATKLNNFVSIPITEVYSNILTGVNSSMGASANMALYQNSFANIWTMIVNGSYNSTTPPANGWSLDVGSGSDLVNLHDGTWYENGTWTADVAGTVNNNTTTVTGQAGGTYADNGTFTGVGAGTWAPAQ